MKVEAMASELKLLMDENDALLAKIKEYEARRYDAVNLW